MARRVLQFCRGLIPGDFTGILRSYRVAVTACDQPRLSWPVRSVYMRFRQLAILAITAGGCGLAEEPAASTVQSAIACSMITCGGNAPTAGDGLLFDEFDLFGRPNYAGVAMTGANLDDGTPVNIQIWNDT
ncbi:MAG: hypothetical protein ACREBE_03520, partial [bacterium]